MSRRIVGVTLLATGFFVEAAMGKDLPSLELRGHSDPVVAVSFLPNGPGLVTADCEHTICFWNTTDGKKKQVITAPFGGIRSLCISQDGKLLAVGGLDPSKDSGRVTIWSTDPIVEKWTADLTTEPVQSLAFSSDSTRLAAGYKDGLIVIRNVGTGKAIATISTDQEPIQSIVFSPDGSHLAASVGFGGRIAFWSAKTFTLERTANLRGRRCVTSLRYGLAGATLAAGTASSPVLGSRRGDVVLVGPTGEERAVLSTDGTGVTGLCVSSNGKKVISAGLAANGTMRENEIRIWDLTTKDLLLRQRWPGERTTKVTSVSIAPDARSFATGDMTGTVILWSLP
jgi:WD40 repeat protein